jgi:hypothetical protein
MVEFIIPKCESCGAELHIPPGQESGTCEYCGTDFRVVDQARSAPTMGGAGSELEKKELALKIAQKDLQSLQTQSWQLKSRIDSIERPPAQIKKGGAIVVFILGIMAIFMTLMLGLLFYFLQIYYIYGLTKTTCPLLMLIVISVSIGLMVFMKIASDIGARKRYEAGLADPEYPKIVAQFNELQPKIQSAQSEADKREQELRDFVK